MPKRAKDKVIEELENVVVPRAKAVKTAAKSTKATAIKTKTTKIDSDKTKNNKTAKKQTTTKKTSSKTTTEKNKTANKTKSTAKNVVAKNSAKTSKAKTSSTKKTASKTTTAKKQTASKATKTPKTTKSRTKKKVAVPILEYYDLANTYEQTIVKILAQTPTVLFVYWDISNKDKQKFIKQYGESFFEQTTPFLLVINKTKNYQFDVEVNDYANSWYLHIPDSDCEYEVILMRKNKSANLIAENNGIMTITSSNNLETPNDHILFEKLGKTIFFQNIKTQKTQEKSLASFSFIHNMGKIYNIYDLYKEIYQNELNGDELGSNLSSSNFSSNFK